MTTLVRWNPNRELVAMQRDMDRMVNAFFGKNGRNTSPAATGMPLDVTESDTEYTIVASVPGFTADDIEVTLEENVLTITAEVRTDEDATDDSNNVKIHIRERRFGRSSRSLRLPTDINGEAITAAQSNGILTLTVPKAEETKPRRIEIR